MSVISVKYLHENNWKMNEEFAFSFDYYCNYYGLFFIEIYLNSDNYFFIVTFWFSDLPNSFIRILFETLTLLISKCDWMLNFEFFIHCTRIENHLKVMRYCVSEWVHRSSSHRRSHVKVNLCSASRKKKFSFSFQT